MRKPLLAFLALALLGAASPASAHRRIRLLEAHAARAATPTHDIRLITPSGNPADEPWQRWITLSRVSTGAYTLMLDPSLDCGGALGCSTGPVHGDPSSITNVLTTTTDGRLFARDTLYFELGHQFDWHFLTNADRRYLARAWGVPRAHWWNSTLALSQHAEDGLEGDFAAVYRNCAWGMSTGGLVPVEPENATVVAPTIYPTINTCAFINRIAAVRVARVSQ